MPDSIEPALTPEQWASDWIQNASTYGIASCADGHTWEPELSAAHAKIIAVANHRLPDTDPRKITREMVANLRALAGDCPFATPDVDPDVIVRNIAAALASYLPPEEP